MVRLIRFIIVNLLLSKLVIEFIASEYSVKDRLVMAFKSKFKTMFLKNGFLK